MKNHESQIDDYFLPINYQARFLRKFLSEASAPFHYLIAPTGTGKTLIASYLVWYFVHQLKANRVLILVEDRGFAEEYQHIVYNDRVVNTLYVNRRVFREFGERESVSRNPWPDKIYAILDLENAYREDIRTSLISTQWDLVIADNSYMDLLREKPLILAMIKRRAAQRLLLLDQPGREVDLLWLKKMVPTLKVTHWKAPSSISLRTRLVINFKIVKYARTPEEIAFIRSYQKLSTYLKDTPFRKDIRLRLASSSLYAAEQSLRSVRNKITHESQLSFIDDLGMGDQQISRTEPESERSRSSERLSTEKSYYEPHQVLQRTINTLEKLKVIQTDSKYEALSKILIETRATQSHGTFVYSEYHNTIIYLASSLAEDFADVYSLTSMKPFREVEDNITRFREQGGILVASSRHLRGRKLPIDTIIFHDLPGDESISRLILAGAMRGSLSGKREQREKVDLFVLQDSTNSISSEKMRLSKLRKMLPD
jgi:hypothetical protein